MHFCCCSGLPVCRAGPLQFDLLQWSSGTHPNPQLAKPGHFTQNPHQSILSAIATFRQAGTLSDGQTLAWLNVSLGFTAMFLKITQKYLIGVVCVVAVFAFA